MLYWTKFDENCKFQSVDYILGRNHIAETREILSLDIETTSIWEINGHITSYKGRYSEKQYNTAKSKAFCYIWQFGVNDTVYYGRYLSELPKFLKRVKNACKSLSPIIWVHNLSYEFQFIREHLEEIAPITVFARSERKPIKFNWDIFEFRCSYMLTRKSLETWGKELGCVKMVGDLDYNILRTPKTPMTKTEKGYCKRDCIVVYNGIRDFLKTYEYQHAIPLTQTGRVRRVVKDFTKNDYKYLRKITRMQPSTENEYKLLRAAFMGGSTGACYLNAGKVLHHVGSFDLSSDYPSQIVRQKYPMQKFREVSVKKKTNFEKYAYIFVLKMENITPKSNTHYLPSSKCIALKGAKYDNGKIISAKTCVFICTEQDYTILHDCYNFEEKIIKLFQSKKQYLPAYFVSYVLDLYENKTKLKGVTESEELYKESKEFINALYGMMVTDFVQSEILYDHGWGTATPNIQESLDECHEKFYKNNLPYQWGVWVTAYARRTLWTALLHIDKQGDNVYYDTDSCKQLHTSHYIDYFRSYNIQIINDTRKALNYHGLPLEKMCPKDKKGNRHFIGIWEQEKTYESFVTQGAKRYAYQYDDKVIHCTVSGVPKNNAIALKDLKDFKDGFVFPRNLKKDGVEISKKLVQYVDNSDWCPVIDGITIDNKNSIVMRPTTYEMGLLEDYKKLIDLGKQKKRL